MCATDALPALKENTVSIGLPAVLTKYVSGVPDLHREGYEYPPYREAVDFKYDVHNGFFQTRIGNDSDLIHFFKSSVRSWKTPSWPALKAPTTP